MSNPTRRDFLKTSAAAAALLGARPVLGEPIIRAPASDSYVDDLAMEALNAAKS